MKNMWQIISLLILCTMGCKETPFPTPITPIVKNPCSDTAKELRPVWQVRTFEDTTKRLSTYDMLCYNDKLITCIDRTIHQYDAKTGKEDWQWHNPYLQETITGELGMYYQDGMLVFGRRAAVTALSTLSGTVIKRQSSPIGLLRDARSVLLGNYVYQSFFYGDQFSDSVNYYIRADIKTLRWDTLLKIRRDDLFGYMGNAEPGALYTPTSGDSLVLFKFRSVLSSISERCFFYAYNINQRKIQWRIDSLDYDGNIYPPIIEGNRCYVQGLGSVFCINADNGQIIWTKFCGGRFPGGTNLISYQDRLAAVTLDGRFVCISKETGEFIYQRKDAVGGLYDLASPTTAVEYNGVMYFTGDGYFYGIDLTSFEVLGKYSSPNRCARLGATFGYGATAVNKQVGYIYVDDGYFLMAIKAFK